MSTSCGACRIRPALRFFQIVQDIEGVFAWCNECCSDPDLLLEHQVSEGISIEISEEEYLTYEVMES